MSRTEASRRRPKGSGSLRHFGGDRWQVCVNRGGKRITRVFHAANATEANRAADAVRIQMLADFECKQDLSAAERSRRQSWTVTDYTEYYLTTYAPLHLEPTSYRRYEQIIRNNIRPHIGKQRMSEVTPQDLQALYHRLSQDGARLRGQGPLSGSTIWTVHQVVRAVFTFAVEIQGDFASNPAATKAATPKAQRSTRKPKALDVAEVEQFVALARDHSSPIIADAILLSAYLGTRTGETVGLRWSDLDSDALELHVRRGVTHTQRHGLRVKSTKNGKERVIPLDAYTLSMLKRMQIEQRMRRLQFGRGWQGAPSADEDYMCADEDGAVLLPSRFGQAFRTLAKRLGRADITPHVLRHAFVSQLIVMGFDAVTIASMTGHSPEVLLREYAHAFDKRRREAFEALGEARRAARSA